MAGFGGAGGGVVKKKGNSDVQSKFNVGLLALANNL